MVLKYLGVLMVVGSSVFLAYALWLASEVDDGGYYDP